jgi:hypothetical protein
VFREGENVVCGCWADNHSAWQYSAQLLIAIGGSAALIATTALYVWARRRAWLLFLVLTAAAITWIAFLATGN